MLYIRIGGSDENPTGPLVYYCRKCGNEQQMQKEQLCVSKIQLKRAEQKYDNIINEYTKLDIKNKTVDLDAEDEEPKEKK